MASIRKMTIAQALDGENAFLRQVAEMLDDSVQKRTEPLLAEMRRLARTQTALLSRFETFDRTLQTIAANYERISSYVTVKQLEGDGLKNQVEDLDRDVRKLLDAITPELVSARETPPSPPESPPPSRPTPP